MDAFEKLMKNCCWSLFLFMIVFSCTQSERKPDDILSHDEMVQVLKAIYLAEGKVSHLGVGPDSAAQVFDRMQNRVFEAAGVPDSTIKKSFDFYMERPKELEKIYGMLVDSLQLLEQRSPEY